MFLNGKKRFRWAPPLFGAVAVVVLLGFPRTLFQTTTTGSLSNVTFQQEGKRRHDPQASHWQTVRRINSRFLQQAKDGLSSLDRTRAFETDFSSTESVLQDGFPFSWNHRCTLATALRQKEQLRQSTPLPLRMTITGGSSTARQPNKCVANGTWGGRFSDFIDYDHKVDFVQSTSSGASNNNTGINNTILFDVVNVGHGATDTVWASLVLDELVNTTATDILVWEYATNDALGGASGWPLRQEEHMEAALHLWLVRVAYLFARVGRSPPPIVLLYLWDSRSYQQGRVKQSAWDAQEKVIVKFRKAGLNIAVVNVGGAINATSLDGRVPRLNLDVERWLDDIHHPNCATVRLISAMVRHMIYRDITECEESSSSSLPNPLVAEIHAATAVSSPSLHLGPVYSALLEYNISTSSLMQWVPQSGKSTLTVSGLDDAKTAFFPGARIVSARKDRKYSYKLPSCDVGMLNFTLHEPNLEWLGLGIEGLLQNHGQWRIFLNGQLVNTTIAGSPSLLAADELHLVKLWVNMRDTEIRHPADTHDLAVCLNIDHRSKCPYEHAYEKNNSLADACSAWAMEMNRSIALCPLRNEYAINMECLVWHIAPEATQLALKYGSWTGLSWIIALKDTK